MADDRIERLAWLIQGDTSQPLRTMELARELAAVAKKAGTDRYSVGRLAAHMLLILDAHRGGTGASQSDIFHAVGIALALAGRRTPDVLVPRTNFHEPY